MTNKSEKTDQKDSTPIKPFVKKSPSPFNNDPYNNRSGKGKGKSAIEKGGQKIRSITEPKFKVGTGGDR
jgi:hypothetical protein